MNDTTKRNTSTFSIGEMSWGFDENENDSDIGTIDVGAAVVMVAVTSTLLQLLHVMSSIILILLGVDASDFFLFILTYFSLCCCY